MNVDDIRNIVTSRLKMMSSEERAQAACELYGMNIIDRKDARKLLGINENEYLERAMFGAWYTALEERFDSLSDEFLSEKLKEKVDEYGEY